MNRKDGHVLMISIEKICIKNMGVLHSFGKNKTATMYFLKIFSSL